MQPGRTRQEAVQPHLGRGGTKGRPNPPRPSGGPPNAAQGASGIGFRAPRKTPAHLQPGPIPEGQQVRAAPLDDGATLLGGTGSCR